MNIRPTVALKTTNDETIRPSCGLPVNVTQLIPRTIVPILDELTAPTERLGSVPARRRPTNGTLKPQLKRPCLIKQGRRQDGLGT